MTKRMQLLAELLDQAKSDLLTREKRFKALIEKSRDMMVLRTPEGRILYASPSHTTVLGYPPEEMNGASIFDLVHPDDISGLLQNDMEILKKPGASYTLCVRVKHRDGYWTWCEGTTTNLMEEEGINAIVTNCRDVTQRKAAREQLISSERRFRSFFENAPEGIAILNVETFSYEQFNDSAVRILKYTPHELHTCSLFSRCPEFQPDGARSKEKGLGMVKRALDGEQQVFEWEMWNGEGKLIMLEVRLVAIHNGRAVQLYVSFVDITGRKETERKLLERNKRLSEIAFLQSHQVRKPVASMMGLINLFNFENTADPINAEVLMKMKSAVKMMDEVIGEIVIKTSEIEKECGK